jgi:hypothetical protein
MATLTLRIPKGSPLTNAELDDNFANLDNDKVEIGGDLGGSTSNPLVISFYSRPLSSSAPTTGQAIVWNGSLWIPQTVSTGSGSGGTVSITVLNDISKFFDRKSKSFTLKNGNTAITEGLDYGDSRDLLVVIGGRVYSPAIEQNNLGPWIVDMEAENTYTYKVVGSRITFYREPEYRQTASIRINNISASRQQRTRYPFTPNTIAFGD